MKPRANVLEADDWFTCSVGSASTLNPTPMKNPPKREFWIGFHVAAPGPSHDEDAPRRRKRKAPALAETKAGDTH